MAIENIQVYRIVTGDSTYPHSGNFTIVGAGQVSIDDSDGRSDSFFGDFTHSGGRDVPDQNVTASSVAGVNVGDTIDPRYKYTVTGSDGSNGTVYFLATNSTTNYGPIMASDFPLDPSVTYTFQSFNTDGGVPYDTLVPCFVAGTRILTKHGLVAIEDLSVGDMIETADHGLQPLKWIGASALDSIDLAMKPKLRPILIRAGALGQNMPLRDLYVSPQHRVLVRSRIAERMFDQTEVLVPALKLLGLPGVEVATQLAPVTYFHILFDSHQIIFSEGAATESLYTGPEAIRSISPQARQEVTALFPEIAAKGYRPSLARPVPPTGRQMRRLVERHAANGRALQ